MKCEKCIHYEVCDLNRRLSGNTNSLMYDEDCKLFKEHNEGRWKGAGLGDYLCSNCWSVFSGGDEYNYCPNCGAKMSRKEDGGNEIKQYKTVKIVSYVR